MTSVLLVHPHSLSQATIPRPPSSSSSSSSSSTLVEPRTTPISLPSRFPTSTTPPQIALSSEGHSFVYAKDGNVVWEYDNKQRRISEFVVTQREGGSAKEKVGKVGCLIKDVVVVSTVSSTSSKDGGAGTASGLRVMEKIEGKWKCINVLEGPAAPITALASDADSTLVVAGSEKGELIVYDREKGSRVVVPLSKRIAGPISPLLKFSSSLPSTLVLPSTTSPTLLRLTLPNNTSSTSSPVDIREIRPFGSTARGEIVDIAFSPVTETAEGVRKGGLCAVLRRGGVGEMVALVGLDNLDSAAKMVSFGEANLEGLTFLDGATLAARTSNGTLFVKDLRALGKPPVEIRVNEAILDVRVLPPSARAARPSIVPPSTTSSPRTTILGENRNTSNVATPPVPEITQDKPKEADIQKPQQRKVVWNENERESVQTAPAEPVVPSRTRIVSAPPAQTQPSRAPRQSTSNLRSTSGPVASTSSHTYRTPAPHTGGSRGTTPIIEENEDDEEDAVREMDDDEYEQQHSVDLTWALKPSTERGAGAGSPVKLSDAERMEEMRREIGNLQLDMLRMGRSLKNEIRRAVQPLLEEMRENREVIERQRREIERLRRGY
ncbi:hypothetical protein CI109_104275 [Kwoniella shandongensis]|uniref:Uncharacterized protein n=1 Tax=Kwoniella shandongensis TaxID=1734106 RepID=A0A5M6C1S9_9TREE|nr:uncharacterized protein CI109_002819 [Kwoniella shandongensis]KAA5528661.1 hypothetical protein CI109_002819 [Kwoniella shandongensis]